MVHGFSGHNDADKSANEEAVQQPREPVGDLRQVHGVRARQGGGGGARVQDGERDGEHEVRQAEADGPGAGGCQAGDAQQDDEMCENS